MNCPIPVVRKKINFGHIRPTSTMESLLVFVSILLVNFGTVVVASGNGGILSASWKQLETAPTVGETKLESSMANDSRGNGSFTPHEGEVEEKEVPRYHVAKFDFEYVSTNLMIAVWVLFASIAKIAFHSQKKLAKLFPESCLLIVIGVILGIILYFSPADDYNLDAQIFFLILLPPIILDAGYFMPSRSFFDNLGTILLYAVIGTLLNTLFIGFTLWGVDRSGIFQLDLSLELLHCLVFASLLAAVDPVAVLAVFESIHINEILHIVVFGESLLNDGISVVLYHMFEGFSEIGMDNIIAVDVISGIASFFVIVFGATGIGILCGLLGGILSRFTRHVRVMEPLTVFVIGYLSFLLAEMFHLSGILSCTFCGITMKKYVEVNISQKSQTTIKYMLKMTASVCETIIFMYLGVSAVNKSHQWNTAFILLTLLFCLVYRTIGVIILTYFANRVRLVRLNKIDQFIMAYGGLRGAIAFALVVLLDAGIFPQRQLFVTTTVVVIYFTNLVMGSTIQPLVNFLKVKKNENQKPMMNEKINFRIMDHIMAGIEDISGQKGHNLLRERFSHFNNKYLKPIIVGKHHPSQKRGYEIFNVYKRLSIKDAKGLAMNPSSPASLSMINSQIRRLSSLVEVSQANNWLSPSDEEAGHRSVIRPAALENHTASNGHARPLGLNIDKPSAMSHNRTNHVNQCGPDQSREPRFSVALNSNRPLIYHRHMLNSTTSLAYPESNDSSWYTPQEDQDNNNNGRRQRKSVLFSIDLDQENPVPAEKDEDGAIYFGNAGQNNPSPDNFTVVDMERNVRGNESSSQPTDWGIGSAVNSGFTNAAFITDNGNVPGHLRDIDNAVQIDHLSSSAPEKVLTNQRKSIGSKMADEKTCSASLSNKLGSEEMHLDKYPTANSCCDSSAMLCENQLDCGSKALPDEKSDHSTYMNCYSSPGANFATSSNHSDGSRRPRNSKFQEKCDITEESKF